MLDLFFHDLRVLGNIALLVGYVIMLRFNFKLGLKTKFIAGLLSVPSLVILGLWDSVVLCTIFSLIELDAIRRG